MVVRRWWVMAVGGGGGWLVVAAAAAAAYAAACAAAAAGVAAVLVCVCGCYDPLKFNQLPPPFSPLTAQALLREAWSVRGEKRKGGKSWLNLNGS